MAEKKQNYKELLEDAAWDADPDFKYIIDVKEETSNSILLARGSILLENKEENFKYKYRFSIGIDKGMLFGETYGNDVDAIRIGDFRKKTHNEIIDFNEKLARGICATKIVINDEKSRGVRNLYCKKGYNMNKTNPLNLEKVLK